MSLSYNIKITAAAENTPNVQEPSDVPDRVLDKTVDNKVGWFPPRRMSEKELHEAISELQKLPELSRPA